MRWPSTASTLTLLGLNLSEVTTLEIRIYLHFISLLCTEIAQVVEILFQNENSKLSEIQYRIVYSFI